MNEEKYNLQNPHPVETRKYSYRDMMECWVAARENLVRWGVGDGDKPDFFSWIRENFDWRRDVAIAWDEEYQKQFAKNIIETINREKTSDI